MCSRDACLACAAAARSRQRQNLNASVRTAVTVHVVRIPLTDFYPHHTKIIARKLKVGRCLFLEAHS